jgi:hypothetical protein
LYFGARWLSVWLEPLGFSPEYFRELPAAGGLAYVPAMLGALVGVGIAGTMLGHWFEAARFPGAVDWAALAVFAGGLALVAWRGDGTARRTMVAMAVLALGIYGVIAVGRAGVYAFFNANLTFAATGARYHYVAMVPITILLCLILEQLATSRLLARFPRGLVLSVGLGLVAVAYLRSNFHIDEHAHARASFWRTVQEMAEAVAASPPSQTLYLENEPLPAIAFGPKVFFPGRAAVFVLVSPSDRFPDDRRVRFIERDPAVREYWSVRPKTRMSMLLVAPDHGG